MMKLNWDFAKLSTVAYETNEYTLTDSYQNISVVTDTADIAFVPSEDGSHRVVCREQKNMPHTVTVADGTLSIELVDTRKWYEHIGITIGKTAITVYMPRGEYGTITVRESTGDVDVPSEFTFERADISTSTGDVKYFASVAQELRIKASTGDIRVENVSAGTCDLSVSTGHIAVDSLTCAGDVGVRVSTGDTRMNGVRCRTVRSSGDTGDIVMRDVIAADAFAIERSTGDVTLDGCDAATVTIKTDTGRVNAVLLSEKVFITETDTGRVDVPKTTTGGRCEIITDTGDIRAQIRLVKDA